MAQSFCTAVTEAKGDDANPYGTSVGKPSKAQLQMLGLANALPFMGFGFLDNFLMILFGELIDSTFCVVFGFSTMAAAAIGNTLSDTVGIFAAGTVEAFAVRCGVQEPPLTPEQKLMHVTKVWQYAGQCIGIIIGCTLGCCPLLWLDPLEGERLKRKKEQDRVFQSMVNKLQDRLCAEAVCLFFVDRERGELICNSHTANLPISKWPIESGFMGHVARTGRYVNIVDVKDEPLYSPEIHENLVGSGICVTSLLCLPIHGQGEVVGLMLAINKKADPGHFSSKDEDILAAISSHIYAAMGDSEHVFEEILESCEQSTQRQVSTEWGVSGKQRQTQLYLPALAGISSMLGAEATALMMLDSTGQELYCEAIHGEIPKHCQLVSEGIAGHAVERGQILNVDASDPTWFDPGRHSNYQGSGIEVRSELCVPLFDTSRKCLGVIKCLNKKGGHAFEAEDVEYANQVAQHLAFMLEGPEAGLKRVLAFTRMRMQAKDACSFAAGSFGVVCHLEQAQNLPGNVLASEGGIDPYVTFSVAKVGDPLLDLRPGLEARAHKERNKDKKQPIRKFAKSETLFEQTSPQWNATMMVTVPPALRAVPIDQLSVLALIWDYHSLKQDSLVAYAVFPMAQVPEPGSADHMTPKPYPLMPVPGQQDRYSLDNKARIWVSLSKQTKTASFKGA